MKKQIINFSINSPKTVIVLSILLFLAALAQFPKVKIDTNPEHMLSQNEEVILHHHELKEKFKLEDILVVGIHKESGVFNPKTLEAVALITEEALEMEGVIANDVVALTEVDDIVSDGGTIKVETLMEEIPETDEEGRQILERIKLNPLFNGKLASDDGTLVTIFVPIESKEISAELAEKLKVSSETHLKNGEDFLVAGLPVAESTFGAEMFKQMAVYAPLAGLVIFLLLLFFFRSAKVIAAPMIIAVMTVVYTMGALIGLGFTVHIMSSMIPIFLMPIAVLDSTHIVSEFYDTYQKTKDSKKTLREVLNTLFMPMLFTSLTTIVGFASLAFTPIPPVEVFGSFVALGVFLAWLLTMTFLPAFISLMPAKALENFGTAEEGKETLLDKFLAFTFRVSKTNGKLILAVVTILFVISGYGVTKIIVNDNPVNWFKPDHELRKADVLMNSKIGGTYMSHLVFTGEEDVMKSPEVVNYIRDLQDKMDADERVGATTSVIDILEKINLELLGKIDIPQTLEGIAQYLFLFEISGGDPEDLFKFVTPEYSDVHIWIQMPKGDNKIMHDFALEYENYLAENPPPENIQTYWAGLNYVNVVWQDKMVGGMGKSLIGSFVMVLVMMTLLFRSFKWGIISMVPLSVTIVGIYGLIGFSGKFYDMPIAVLSSLTLGLSIDFAIHFIKRARDIHAETNDFAKTIDLLFESTGRAISRNVMIIAIGFLPLFFATLVPYKTVGTFFFLIMMMSGFATLFILPSISNVFSKSLFKTQDKPQIKNLEHSLEVN
ncbi:MAG: RND transporter [Calditrichaeota bacterium]|nr:MAG: RND transporter [Calditrichota bacterium]